MYNSPHEFHKRCVLFEVRKLAHMDQDEFSIVEDYLHSNQYPKGILKGDMDNLRCKCKNFKFALFQKSNERKGDEEWGGRFVLQPKKKKRCILKSCHAAWG